MFSHDELMALRSMNIVEITHASKDRPILAWCCHDLDPYIDPDDPRFLTPYASHVEGLGEHVSDGWHVLEWGGEHVEYGQFGEHLGTSPDWWFEVGTNFERAANPILCTDMPVLPDFVMSVIAKAIERQNHVITNA